MKKSRVSEGELSLLEQQRAAISRCVKCGTCRSVCPPFLLKLDESLSARGRMALVEAVIDAKLPVSQIFADRLASCAGCLACETVCACAVPVTEIIQAAREQAVRESGNGLIRTVIAEVLKSDLLMRSSSWLAPLVLHYRAASVTGGGKRIHSKFKIQDSKGPAGRPKKGTVLFFPGCSINYYQPAIGSAADFVLNRIGYEVIVPDGLKCCGRPFLSLGDRRAAQELALQNSRIISAHKVEAVVTACASCSLTFKKEYHKLLAPDAVIPSVLDIHEFLAGRIAPETLALGPNRKVTWHDPCHLARGQGLAKTARDLVRVVPGIDFIEMRNPERCCGFGGMMRVTHPGISDGIADNKVRDIMATKASAVLTGCPSCAMQIRDGIGRAGSGIEVLHTVQLLAEALAIAE